MKGSLFVKTLSVVVPVYNSEMTIEKCMKSIMGQTYRNLEIIVVIDGGEDQSCRICKEFAYADERVNVFENKHMGVTAARKTGVSMASGEYVAFVDSDDWIEECYFEKLMEDVDGVDVVIAEHYIIEQNKECTTVLAQHLEKGIYSGDEVRSVVEKLMTTNGIDCCLWNKILKTSLVQSAIDNVNDNIYLFEDLAILLQVLLVTDKVKILGMAGYHYCVNKKSLVHSVHKDYLLNLHFLFCLLEEVLEKCTYKEKLVQGFYRYMRHLLFQSGYYLGIEIEDMEIRFQDVYYPYYGRLENARVILYGAGYVGMSYYYHIKNDKETEIVAWVDKEPEKCRGRGCFDVQSPDVINKVKYDYIILAVWEEKDARAIMEKLVKSGISEDIILWNKTKKMSYIA